MTVETKYFRLRIRNKADDANLLILDSTPDGENPYLTAPPDGDGQSFDPLTGAPSTGSYTFRAADAETADGRVVTSLLADVYARQQMIGLRAYGEVSSNGSSWTTLIPGYVLSVRLISAIEYAFQIGDTRRREQSRELFKAATTQFPGVTCVIGGPVIGGFAGMIPDNGGWTYHVNQVATTPDYVQLKIDEGFDPRKPPYDTFTTVTEAIADFTNDWARPYWEPATNWLLASTAIQGHFPQLRAKLIPDGGDESDALYFVPLSEPEDTVGPWWDPNPLGDNLMRDGESSLWLPVDGVDANGDPVVFAPSVSDVFQVWVYALPVSRENPLHIYERPVDLWEKIRLELGYTAGDDYDDTNLTALTTEINARLGGDVKVALRIMEPMKAPDIEQKAIYGPFLLSSRINDGLLQLFSRSVVGKPAPTTVVTIDDLRSDEGTVFDLDESTVVTAITVKQQTIRLWTTDEQDQPEADGLIATPSTTDTIENSDDDIPAGLEHTVVIGDIPGMVLLHDDTPADIVPLPFEQYLRGIGDEMFQRFGRGAIAGEISCLSDIDQPVGEEFIANLMHRPVSDASQSPVTQRGGEQRVQIVQRTESVEGPKFRIINSEVVEITGGVDTGVGGGTEEETDPTGITPTAPIIFALGGGSGVVNANWVDSYPQFATYTQWEAHPPSDSTFNLLYGGEHSIVPGVFTDSVGSVGLGWTVRFRYQLTDGALTSAWSDWSNEVVASAASPSTPTSKPFGLIATSTVTDEAHAEWQNSDVTLQVRIQWQGSVEETDPQVWNNVAGGTRLLDAATEDDDQPTGAAKWAQFRLQYVNSSGVAGPWTKYSTAVEIMT
jgi:hypothetical protein